MADIAKTTDGPAPNQADAFDITQLPDYDNDFVDHEGIKEFAKALAAPESSPSQDNQPTPTPPPRKSLFITALNDWQPIRRRVQKRRRRARRGRDETREGYVYRVLKWPLLFTVLGWLVVLGVSYLVTRTYIYVYEQCFIWRGTRQRLRKRLNESDHYEEWVERAKKLDSHLGGDRWRKANEYAYYDHKTVRRVRDHLKELRRAAEAAENDDGLVDAPGRKSGGAEAEAIHELRRVLEGCVKNNFVGFENPRVYCETYYGTKNLVQDFVDEMAAALSLVLKTTQLSREAKREFFSHLYTNYGRTALCLSGGACFAYYHLGVAKALLDADLLPDIITGTSGGALIAALLATRTNEELKKIIVPALAARITACSGSTWTWMKRWWRTGARFDSVDWACRCSWFTRGTMTFREAYIRTGRILNVSCVPLDPHSPTILTNYLTSPDCVIWSAVLASAAVPGILNPVVLMKKVKYTDPVDGTERERLEPYSFGHKWKDGSLRTDVPLRALNMHFNVNFSIVSQVNPHVNLFFFASRGNVGRPVTHRKGRGWRGGYMGSAIEQYLKLDLTKWLKVLRHLELLPRPMGQDWSEVWLQKFSGTITTWPKSVPADFYHILTDPTPARLARMIRFGQLSTWPKLKFLGNRMVIERLIENGLRTSLAVKPRLAKSLSDDDLRRLLRVGTREVENAAGDQMAGGSDDDETESAEVSARGAEAESGDDEDDDDVTPMTEEQRGESHAGDMASDASIAKRIGGWCLRSLSLSPAAVREPGGKTRLPDHGRAAKHVSRLSDSAIAPHEVFAQCGADDRLTRWRSVPDAATPPHEVYAQDADNQLRRWRSSADSTPRPKELSWDEEQRRWDAVIAYREAQSQGRGNLADELRRPSGVFLDDESDGEDLSTDEDEDADGGGEGDGASLLSDGD